VQLECLNGVNLIEAQLSKAKLINANHVMAFLMVANFSEANLHHANLFGADLREANLSNTNLRGANLSEVNLRWANLTGADLSEAELVTAILVGTNLNQTNLTNCSIYGISAWNVQVEEAIQLSLVITPKEEPMITVDNLEVAQFIYLLLNNKKIRHVIDTITSKVVLILGRFTPERKIILDAIRDELRKQNYTPVLFDFEKPANRDLTETVGTAPLTGEGM
jgi:uncharacterized protein YjbI with pentapeptide repeats